MFSCDKDQFKKVNLAEYNVFSDTPLLKFICSRYKGDVIWFIL